MEAAKCTPFDLSEENDKDLAECAVCLQPYVYPAQLPCGHIFCFLCIKGTANQSKRCAMCRQEIPRDFIKRPNLLKGKEVEKTEQCSDGTYQWFYEGRNGWWQYDERTSKELETAYNSGERTCELLIAGFLYVMDFDAMLQLRRTDPSRRRRMKRDLLTIDKKGIAGLRIEHNEEDAAVQPIPQNMRSRGFSTEGATGSQPDPTPTSASQISSIQPSHSRRDDGLQPGRQSPIVLDSSTDEDEDPEDEGEIVESVELFANKIQNINLDND